MFVSPASCQQSRSDPFQLLGKYTAIDIETKRTQRRIPESCEIGPKDGPECDLPDNVSHAMSESAPFKLAYHDLFEIYIGLPMVIERHGEWWASLGEGPHAESKAQPKSRNAVQRLRGRSVQR